MAIRPLHKVFYHTEKQITIQGYWKVEIYDILNLRADSWAAYNTVRSQANFFRQWTERPWGQNMIKEKVQKL